MVAGPTFELDSTLTEGRRRIILRDPVTTGEGGFSRETFRGPRLKRLSLLGGRP